MNGRWGAVLVAFGKRLAATVVMLFATVIGTFLLTRVIPANPAQLAAGLGAPPEQVEIVKERLGLNLPLHEQLGRYLGGIFQGDFGTSFMSHRSVSEDIVLLFPATFELVVSAIILTVLLGLPIGAYLALGRSRAAAGLLRAVTVGGMGIPPFVIGLLLQVFLFGALGLFPSGTRLSASLVAPPTITGAMLLDSLIAGDFIAFLDSSWHLVLPTLALAIPAVGYVARYTEAEVLKVADSDYVRTAKAVGARGGRLVFGHIARNALIPVLTLVGLLFGWMLGGTVLVESIFSWPGLGAYVLNSIASLDFNPAIISALVLAACFVLINMVVDLLQIVIDPRVKVS